MMTRSIFTMFLLLSSCAFFKTQGPLPLPGSLEEAVSSSSRDRENVERDVYQHPAETLRYFGIKPQMTVAHISPGAGYFTEILAPYLAREGQYVMVVPRLPSRPPAFLIENERKLQEILLRYPEVQTKSRFIPFEPFNKKNSAKPGFADMVVTFNSIHNWVSNNSAPFAFRFFHDLLKPGGILGVVQHRIHRGKKKFPKSGYMTEEEVIALATRAGFKFVGRSQINANPKDKADYPKGVWTLPPVYRLGEKDRDKYEAIGESDRMTLKFRKES